MKIQVWFVINRIPRSKGWPLDRILYIADVNKREKDFICQISITVYSSSWISILKGHRRVNKETQNFLQKLPRPVPLGSPSHPTPISTTLQPTHFNFLQNRFSSSLFFTREGEPKSLTWPPPSLPFLRPDFPHPFGVFHLADGGTSSLPFVPSAAPFGFLLLLQGNGKKRIYI